MVPGERELHEVAARLERAGIPFVPITETCAPWNGALMAIGCAPTRRKEDIYKLLSSLPLLK